MVRRYMGRQTANSANKKIDSLNGEKIDEIDPLDETQRKIVIQHDEYTAKNHDSVNEEIDEIEEENPETIDTINASIEDFQKRMERIEKIKKINEDSDSEIEVLTEKSASGVDPYHDSPKPESEVNRIRNEVTDLIVNNNKQRLKVMELQIQSEKKQSLKLNQTIQQKMETIDRMELEIRDDLSNQISTIIDDATSRKIKIMQLQLESERRLSNELNEKIKENMATISQYEFELQEQRDKLEVEVKAKTKKLLQAERLSAIGELAARVAHDLRNPLSVIKGSVELIKVKNDTKGGQFIIRQVNLIERAISRMSHQIEDVLDFVKPIPLKTSKNSILKTINYALEKTNLSDAVLLNLPANDIQVMFDSDKMDVVFDNLFTNAKQAIEDDGEITVKLSEDEKFVSIGIIDSGPGIPEDILPNIFEPLITTKQTGTGLGLASCLSIIQLHGGLITAKNNPTTFTIKLPK